MDTDTRTFGNYCVCLTSLSSINRRVTMAAVNSRSTAHNGWRTIVLNMTAKGKTGLEEVAWSLHGTHHRRFSDLIGTRPVLLH